MAKHLYRLGRWCFGHRKTVLVCWVLALMVLISLSSAFSRPPSTEFSIPGTQSQQAIDLLNKKFPGASGATAQIVFAVPDGQSVQSPTTRSAIEQTVALAKKAPQVAAVVDPYTAMTISANNQIAYASVIYPVPVSDISQTSKDALEKSAGPARAAGITVAFGGGVVTASSASSSEIIGLLIAYFVLALTFGSMLAAGLPLLTALIGVGIGLMGINAIGAVVNLSATAPILATMVGLAVAIDYALFILQRYRQQLAHGLEPHEAAARAVATAGSAVVFAGLTVVIALLGLAVVNIPFLTIMGVAAAGTVIVAVVIALTLLPAMIGFTQKRITPAGPSKRRAAKPVHSPTLGTRWVTMLTKHPTTVVVAGLIVIAVLAYPALNLHLGLPDAGSQPAGTTGRVAYDLLTEGFGPGFNGPLLVVVNAPNSDDPAKIAETAVTGLKSLPDVAAVSPPFQNPAKDVTIISVTPKSSPTSDQTADLVTVIRHAATEIQHKTGIEVFVTGSTAVNIDVSNKLSAALPIYLIVVVGLALLLLMLVFRSLLVPLKAAIGFLLSIAAAMGVVEWVFEEGHFGSWIHLAEPGPIVSFLPILLIGILFGLAMDYEVFLVSRMREHFVASSDARESIVTGFEQSGRVVVAAGVIMIGVFASFIFADDVITKSIGFSLTVGVFVDAFLVRLTLVPAAMTLMGRRAWWLPHWLDRVLPNVDIEGANLDA